MISYGNFRSVRYLSLNRTDREKRRDRLRALSRKRFVKWLIVGALVSALVNGVLRWVAPSNQSENLSFLSAPASFEYLKMTDLDVAAILRARLPESFQSFAVSLARHLLEVCQANQMDPALVLAMIDEESDFDPRAISHRGAHGLMQIMPKTANWLSRGRVGEQSQLLNPFENVALGIQYLAHLKELVREMMDLPEQNSRNLNRWVLAAYNLGPNRLKELKTLNKDYQPSVTLQRYIDGIQKNVNNIRARRDRRGSVRAL